MPIIEISVIPFYLKKDAPIICLDLGKKTIGIAISDRGLSLANPRPMLKRTKFSKDAITLLKLFQKENVSVSIIGLPLNMNGSSGPQVQATRAFVHNMIKLTKIPFVFQDERLSTIAATRTLIQSNVSRKQRANRIDSAAAAFILQGTLDRFRFLKNNDSIKKITLR
ncbi:MAG: putative holliday junction resolvase [Candidatus Tokpelaia sp. JSC161]|jgi:putative Holliday junction resolvase|nr:MAG: putative holliday junction resolvase [Candidatus Tokpelaia sp. JSC161]